MDNLEKCLENGYFMVIPGKKRAVHKGYWQIFLPPFKNKYHQLIRS